ncbi:MAG: peptidyl-prolyl cis-trans isomerase cyclophilin type [Acidimicrobiaceae bacterium]|nr:peptidyl-prolyl cis-trans isomerase cyclophilin type [Acidimicrobiaceae bacterium]
MATSKRERQKAARREKLERQERYDKRRKKIRRGIIVAIIAVLVVGTGAFLFSGGKKTPTTTTTASAGAPTTTTTLPTKFSITQAQSNAKALAYGCPTSTATRVNTMSFKTPPPLTINKAATYDATFDTTAGTFVVQLDAATAPITTNNFIFLAEHNFYKCVIFHRVITGFMIQSGDPTGTGQGSPGYSIPDEYPKAASPNYPLYSIAMANTGSPHTGGSQFFIVTGAAGETLPNTYSLFGKVISGYKAVNTIQDAGSASSSGVPPGITYRILNIAVRSSS